MELNFNLQETLNYLETFSDERTKDWPFVQNPYYVVLFVGLYILLVIVGPYIMKNKKPFDLKYIIIIYNLMSVVWSAYMCILLFRYGLLGKHFNFLCYTVDKSNDNDSIMLAWGIYIYYISKLVELFDTFFFILRKKNNQISFLHVYHHATMPINFWLGTKFSPGGETYLSPMINCFVHVFMYAYYGLSAFGPWIEPYLWWKKYITMLQMTQFAIVITKTFATLMLTCSFPNVFLWAQLFYMISLLILFLNFYRNAYKHRRSPNRDKKQDSANGVNHTPIEQQNGVSITKRR